MKIGLLFANAGPFSQPELLAHLATTAEKVGVESLWTVEHVVIPQGYNRLIRMRRTARFQAARTCRFPTR